MRRQELPRAIARHGVREEMTQKQRRILAADLRRAGELKRSIDKRRITGRYGTVSENTLQQVEEALRVATGLINF